VHYTVTFSPRALADYTYDLIVATEREKFVVPLRALGPRGALSFPDAVAFPPTPVKTPATSCFVVRNTGTRAAEFVLRPPPGWVASPGVGTVDVGGHAPITVTFTPAEEGPTEGEMEVALPGTGTSAFVALKGTGTSLPLRLSKAEIALPPTFVTLTARTTVELTNDSDV